MDKFSTPQEEFWAGHFGDEYVDRNRNSRIVASNIALFSKALARVQNIRSVIEFGANVGLNLIAIRQLVPEIELSAVELNQKAIRELEQTKDIKVYPQSILDFVPDYPRDLVVSKGVLIHMNPDRLSEVYEVYYRSSGRYLCLAEYYNPTPVAIPYRGHTDKLFKRDFAGEMLDAYPDLTLIDYGFAYRRDAKFPQDDITWFLLEKVVGQQYLTKREADG